MVIDTSLEAIDSWPESATAVTANVWAPLEYES
jgi:hypothetical protein